MIGFESWWALLVAAALALGIAVPVAAAGPPSGSSLDPYDVVWLTPSKDAAGSMPLGNGEVGINLWAQQDGDLQFYISRTDSFSEISRLLKVGEVRLSITPNPFASGQPFRQELHLHDGICEITAGEGARKVSLRVFVDADHPVIHCEGQSSSPISVRASIVSWRTAPHVLAKGEEENSAWSMHGAPYDLVESADVFPTCRNDSVAWYHRNDSTVVPATLKLQSLESCASTVHDPLIHRTFGGWVTGSGFSAGPDHSIQTRSPVKSFSVRVAAPCAQMSSAQEWLDWAHKVAGEAGSEADALRRTKSWWHSYWDRSWVFTNARPTLTIPGESHPLRIGYDSTGQNRFPGQIGRTDVYGHALSSQEVAILAAAGKDAPAPVKDGLQFSGESFPKAIPNGSFQFKNGLTLEAWIKLDATTPGRVFDKLTAGQGDGFLFDNYPGNALRLIVGNTTVTAPTGILRPGDWHNIAATVDVSTGHACIYLDGKVVAGQPAGTAENDVSPITRGYVLQRYVQACEGRGAYPIKFNGGIFTVEPAALGKPFDADWRAWGDSFWWQNSRHMYHPMLASGDFEMMDPLFRMYEAVEPLCAARAALYHSCSGCYFPETMTPWGAYSNGDYGWNRAGHKPSDVLSPWWQYAWNQGPELVSLMLDRWDYTRNRSFLEKQLLPMATAVLQYFDTRFKKDATGHIILDPTQAVETYWSGVVNDMPSTAGLNDITARLCALPSDATTGDQRNFFAHMKAACPAVPIEQVEYDGKMVRQLAPAEKFVDKRTNCENPELYAVWPFRLYGLGRPDLNLAREAYQHRLNHLDVGWGYDGNCAALLGLTDEAARILEVKCANSNPAYRWPATWGPNFDWLPDQNHGGNLLETTQLMLLQCVGKRIILLPTWPHNWDVNFKLRAKDNTTVECVYSKGKVQKLVVTPASRRTDVVLPGALPEEQAGQ